MTNIFDFFQLNTEYPDQRIEGTRSMSSNESLFGFTSDASYYRPSEFKRFSPPPYTTCRYNLPLFDQNSSGVNLSVPLTQEKLTGSQESSSVTGRALLKAEGAPQTSTGIANKQSVSLAGFSRGQKCKSKQLTPTDRKRRKTNIPEELKDDKYWNKRQRNNLAAKKSRDAKRRHNDAMIQRVTLLEIENRRLCLELSCLQEQNKRLQILLCQPFSSM